MTRILYYLTLPVLLCACTFTTSTKEPKTAPSAASGGDTTPRSKIRNNIQLQQAGLQVSQAFLVYEDGSLVPPANSTNVGRPVKLRLLIEKGWKEADGLVSLGASETIETSDGKTVLHEEDLFAATPNVKAQDAQYVSLTATISQLDKLYDYFLVSFRVWDKNNKNSVSGSYKLVIE